jgi:hypothetical protein
MLYVRWDRDLYDEADDEAEDWLPVDARKYGMNGQGAWEIVPLRAPDQGKEKSESEDEDNSASSSQGASDSGDVYDDSESAGDEIASEGGSDGGAVAEAEPKGKKRAQPTQGRRGTRGSRASSARGAKCHRSRPVGGSNSNSN